ncbi:DUF4062 domain-containing protein [Lacihabitans sp. CS3-21]|uniref:DUF4062 domain-containing protein n=1 Tax=Lacihabitans sp. CS3-21 TaxID=2487332 RepID=UPI0020CE6E7D|nr:DUF4062 domain-containing protein [Lacihabitans sp. CS3-21]MCP9748412.1 DUF4062 domain-containing protein [Lacihabitans sp. CS3-21]
MAKPRVFISSTYYDLKHIRSSLENFIDVLGYESILSEKGSIAYNPDIALDESCYREVQTSDIFVLIIGGRYGSPASSQNKIQLNDFYNRYESVTKLEYENAFKRDIPVYILIEKSVYSEYETFKKNRENTSIKYAHVDSINIFSFIDLILNQPRNNPIHQFEKHIDIEVWLKIQWAGLFQELIRNRKSESEISELSKEVKELSNINTTLKRYLEEIVSKTDKFKGSEIIEEEEERLSKSRIKNILLDDIIIQEMIRINNLTLDEAINLISEPKNFKELSTSFAKINHETDNGKRLLEYWKTTPSVQERFNKLRATLGFNAFDKI